MTKADGRRRLTDVHAEVSSSTRYKVEGPQLTRKMSG
jgi:hypothetical protein